MYLGPLRLRSVSETFPETIPCHALTIPIYSEPGNCTLPAHVVNFEAFLTSKISLVPRSPPSFCRLQDEKRFHNKDGAGRPGNETRARCQEKSGNETRARCQEKSGEWTKAFHVSIYHVVIT